MNKPLLYLFFLFCISVSFSQDIVRSEVKGKIIAKTNDVEGVTVYNTSSEKGTITDFDGNFTIEVGLHERVEISALQFKKFTVIVDEGIVEQKKMTIYLVEQINTLPEVVISPYDLSGNIIVDINRVKTSNLPFKEDEFDLDIAEIDLTPDNKSAVYNPFVKGAGGPADDLGGDVIGLVGFLLKPIFKSKNKKKKKSTEDEYPSADGGASDEIFDLRDMYSNAYMSRMLSIPDEKVNEFIAYVEDKGINYNLLRQGREMEFIDFLVKQSESFLALQSEKN